MKSDKAYNLVSSPIGASTLVQMLEDGSSSLDQYLGESIYCNSDSYYLNIARKRLAETVRLHIENVGDKPVILLRAPGRLNAFLEYLDMCAGDHMSTTIDGDLPVCISIRDDDMVRTFNACRDFTDRTFSISEALEVFRSVPWSAPECDGLSDNWDNRTRVYPHHNHTRGDWMNYVMAPFLRVAWETNNAALRGVDMTFGESNIPRRGGTSSSSAVVVLSFLAVYLANRDRLPKWDIKHICKLLGEAEWYVGTHGGANDHTTILRNQPNCVLYNRHSQPEPDSTLLPSLKGVRLVVANSLWEANKALNANHVFNLRKGWMDLGDDLMKCFISTVCEHISAGSDISTGWISRLLCERYKLDIDSDLTVLEGDPALWHSVRANYKKFGSLDEGLLGIPNIAIEELISILPEEISATHAGTILGKDVSAMNRDYTLPNPDEGGYRVRSAAKFFYKENRIGRMLEKMLLEADKKLSSKEITAESSDYEQYQLRMGWMLDELQKSLREDFQVSNSQLDMLLDIASNGPGYLGGKLTGAGCGGCVVIMVKEGCEEAFCSYLDENYYGDTHNFDNYRRRLSEVAPALAEELLGHLTAALENIERNRRIVTFSAGAGVVEVAKCFSSDYVVSRVPLR